MSDILDQGVGVALLGLASRGSYLVTHLLRLCDTVPHDFLSGTYQSILFGFSYFDDVDGTEARIDQDAELRRLDDEFANGPLLATVVEPLYAACGSIVEYHTGLLAFLQDLKDGVYLGHTLDGLLLSVEGKQLLVEAVHLLGTLLLLTELCLPGELRERVAVAHYRHRGREPAASITTFDAVYRLCRESQPILGNSAGSLRASKGWAGVAGSSAARGGGILMSFLGGSLWAGGDIVDRDAARVNWADTLIGRFALPVSVVQPLVERLRSDDLYCQTRLYPKHEHRSAALAPQASCLFVLLLFLPEAMHSDHALMRELVTRHYADNWVVHLYLGFTIDLSELWQPWAATRAALAGTIQPASVKRLNEQHTARLEVLQRDVAGFLKEGVLSEEFLLENVGQVLDCIRECNITLRWLLLHRTTTNKKLQELLAKCSVSVAVADVRAEASLTLMLDTAALELQVKQMYGGLLGSQAAKMRESRARAVLALRELGDFYAGSRVLSLARDVKDASLQEWFYRIASQLDALDLGDASGRSSSSTTASITGSSRRSKRTLEKVLAALSDVLQLHQLASQLQAKAHLVETRHQVTRLMLLLELSPAILTTVAVVSDCGYFWNIARGHIPRLHARVRKDPRSLLKLRCLFTKLRSVMEMPLLRLSQCSSPDLYAATEFMSHELASFARATLEVVPVNMFGIVQELIVLQTQHLKELPTRMDKSDVKQFVMSQERHALARALQQIAAFTQGIWAMEKTFLGMIELDPQLLLEEGIRRHLSHHISSALSGSLHFPQGKSEDEFEPRLKKLSVTLGGFRKTFASIQDYVKMDTLAMWHQELARVIALHAEQECNAFVRAATEASSSHHQSAAVPIVPEPAHPNFLGRVLNELLRRTHPATAMYISPLSGWFNKEGFEIVGIRTFAQLADCICEVGLAGLDRILCFRIVQDLNVAVADLQAKVKHPETRETLRSLRNSLHALTGMPDASPALYTEICASLSKSWATLLDALVRVGQGQLLRRHLSMELAARRKHDTSLLASAAHATDDALMADIRRLLRETSLDTGAQAQTGLRRGQGASNPSTHAAGGGFNAGLAAGGRGIEDTSAPAGHAAVCLQGPGGGACPASLSPAREHVVAQMHEWVVHMGRAGASNICATLYITPSSMDDLPLLLFVFLLTQLPRFVYDRHLASLVHKSKRDALDFCPLQLGVITLLRQFHGKHVWTLLHLIRQHIAVHVLATAQGMSAEYRRTGGVDTIPEVVNLLLVADGMCKWGALSREQLASVFPPYIADISTM
eukprot:jgi/Mesvir1/26507/Mv16165-RA.1